MPIDLAPGVIVEVDQPDVPVIRAEPPTSLAVVVPVAGPQGPRGPAGSSGTGSDVGQVKLTATAATVLSGHRAVTQRSDGQLVYADNTTLFHLHSPVWLTMGAISSGADGEVLVYGTLTEPSWSWIPGGALYLGANGVLTQTPPQPPAVFSAMIGVATGPTTVFIDRQPSILLI